MNIRINKFKKGELDVIDQRGKWQKTAIPEEIKAKICAFIEVYVTE